MYQRMYQDRNRGVAFLVVAVLFALISATPWGFAHILGLAGGVFGGLLVVMFLFQGLGIVRRAGVSLRVGSLGSGVGSLILSPLLVQQGLGFETPWQSDFFVVLGILFAPVGVLNLWRAYRGGSYDFRLRRTVTYDELVGR